MKKIDACKLRRKGGFTLVELIVVLVLLAVLSAVAVPTYLGYVDDNKAKQCETHRKALASRLEEMSAMGSDIELTDEMINGDENGCPAGGTYTLSGTEDGSAINSKTITCDKHGSTTVMLKNNSQVTAKSSTETEKKVEKEPEKEPEKAETPEPPTDPKFSITVNREKAEMEVDEEQTLTALVVEQTDCTPTGSYTWTVPANFQKIEDNGSSIKIKAVSAGTLCNVSCQSSATVANGSSLNASANTQVTVNEKKNLTVSLYPSTLELTLGEDGKESGSLTANVDISGYNSYACAWTVDKREVAQVTQITGDQTKASVTGLAEGTAIVTCTVTPDNDVTAAQTVTATVRVTAPQKDTVLKHADFEIDGENADQVHWGGDAFTKFIPKDLPAGGVWSYAGNDNLVRFVDNVQIYIDDNHRQGVYPLRYTVGDQVYEMNAYVWYPIYGLDSPMPMESNMYVNDGPKEISAKVHGWFSTATRNVVFTSSAPDVIEIVQGSKRWERGSDNQGWNYVMVNAKSVGEATITMTVEDPTINRAQDEWLITRRIKVSNPNISIWISNIDNLKVGDECSINPQIQPSDISQYSLEYYDYNSEVVSIADGKVAGLNPGKTEVKVRMKRGEEVLATTSFEVTVVSENQEDSEEKFNIVLKKDTWIQGENATIALYPAEGDIQVCPDPIDADFWEGISLASASCDSGKLTINYNSAWVNANAIGDEILHIKLKRDNPYETYDCDGVVLHIVEAPKVTIGGVDFNRNTWDELREYLREKSGNPTLAPQSPAQICVYFHSKDWWETYILKPEANIGWDDRFENMTFEQFYQEFQHNFISVNQYIQNYPSNYYNGNVITKRGNKYYLCLDSGAWGDDVFDQHFIEVALANQS